MSHKHLFHIHNKQHVMCTFGNFHAVRCCQNKDMMQQQRVQFFLWNTVYMITHARMHRRRSKLQFTIFVHR